MKKKQSLYTVLMTIMFIVILGNEAKAQIERFQVAYIYNITRFVEWPDAAKGDAFVIGVVGSKAEIITHLNALASSKTIYSKPIMIKVYNSASDIDDCNILFIPDKSDVGSSIAKTSGKNILVITDTKGAIDMGSAINFFSENNKLQFELKPGNAKKNGLKVSSELESLAAKVY